MAALKILPVSPACAYLGNMRELMRQRKSRFEVVPLAAVPHVVPGARPRILSITHDPSLARTRELLLSKAGYDVSSFLDPAAAIQKCQRETFDLAIVGHSIPLDQRRTLVKALRDACAIPILALTRSGEATLTDADYWCDPSEAPALFLEAVKRSLKQNGEQE